MVLVTLIESVYNFLWGDLLTLPLGGVTLNLSLMVILLFTAGIYFTLRTRLLPMRLFRDMLDAVCEKKQGKQGGLSSLQTLVVSTATRVGMGNLVGVVAAVSATDITVHYDDGGVSTYHLTKFTRSNAGTCVNQRPIVVVGERVDTQQIIADGPSCSGGEVALGKNVLIGFMTWEGYNYEDAVLLNERLVKEDVYTSIHIEEYEIDARDTKLGPEEITRDRQ